ncbi:hypothetical protein ABPG72_012716 [Tetrahymena utriculariae]
MGGKKKSQDSTQKTGNGSTAESTAQKPTPQQEKAQGTSEPVQKKEEKKKQQQVVSQNTAEAQKPEQKSKGKEESLNKKSDDKLDYNTMEYFRSNIISSVENRILNAHRDFELELQKSVHKFNQKLDETLNTVRNHQYNSDITDTASKKKYYFTEKSFNIKNSLLSDLFKISDYRTLYNIVVATFVALAFNLIVVDYVDKGSLFDFDTLQWCFSGFLNLVFPWLILFSIALLVIPFVSWIISNNISKYIWIPIYIIYISLMTFVGCYTCVYYTLGMGSAFIIQCEMVRIGMKMHSYLRNKLLYCTENEYKTFIPKEFESQYSIKDLNLPEFNLSDIQTEICRFIYFFFAPTLIYRDKYILAPTRSFKSAIMHFLNFFLCIYFGFILFKTFCKDQIILLATNFTVSQFIQCLFKLMMPSTFAILLLFFGLLHSWFNGFAELLRFPDRTFYLDWWNSEEFGTYYRKWNIVVHEFLFYYAYGDTVRFSKGKYGRGVGMFITFAVSALIHEVILSFVIGYFYPILLIVFTGPGIILIQNTRRYASKNFNIAFWLLMYIGTSLIITLYLTEQWARSNVDESIIYARWGKFMGDIMPRTLYINFANKIQ